MGGRMVLANLLYQLSELRRKDVQVQFPSCDICSLMMQLHFKQVQISWRDGVRGSLDMRY